MAFSKKKLIIVLLIAGIFLSVCFLLPFFQENKKDIIYHLGVVASNPKLTQNRLITLSQHRHFFVRRGVAHNVNTPTTIIAQLAQDPHLKVRLEAIRNHKILPKLLLKFSKHPHEETYIKKALTINPKTPLYILEKWCEKLK